jgi:hypothetical protein
MPRYTIHVTLRPGLEGEFKGKVEGDTEALAMSAMDDWRRDHGRMGDKFDATREGPAKVGSGTSWTGEVTER